MYQQRPVRWRVFLVPALLTAVAYVDPGNFGTNLEAGSTHGYGLLWVVLLASVAAAVIQYLAALLGLATGGTLAKLGAEGRSPIARHLSLVQAELVVVMTDLAELIGGALGLYLLFGVPLPVGACIVGALSIAILAVGRRAGAAWIWVTLGLLAIVAVAVVTVTASRGVRPGVADGLLPGALDAPGLLLVTAVVGATVMPHALHFHSAVSADAGGRVAAVSGGRLRGRDPRRRLGWAVVGAMVVAGSVNSALVLLGANLPDGVPAGIESAHAALAAHAGPVIATLLGIGLLASGLASTVVGVFTGQVVMEGYLHRPVGLWIRRLVAVVPPLVLLALGVDPTAALVASQAVLALALPVTLVPLLRLALSARVMGPLRPRLPLRAAAVTLTALIVTMDVALVGLVVTGRL
ncbi:Nramp family divalent metal transporter [Agilicoccus flavus]|uniref:Nramp family divalent metal transporter n=1 Tax=Agilicoccus flavus TaxID=2775968 RepID=UPI001CF61B4B|nr:Nramp family divalent metal transporter [Agilicoccus flavus]